MRLVYWQGSASTSMGSWRPGCRRRRAANLTPLLRAHAHAVQEALAEALARGGDGRREALAALDGRGEGPGLGALTDDDGGTLGADPVLQVQDIVLPLADWLAALLDDPDAETRATALRVLVKLGDERVTAARIGAAVCDGSTLLASAATFAAARIARDHPASTPAIVTAVALTLGDDSWRHRLAAVEALGALGAPGLKALDRARADRNALVRATALELLARHSIDLPAPPSRMP